MQALATIAVTTYFWNPENPKCICFEIGSSDNSSKFEK